MPSGIKSTIKRPLSTTFLTVLIVILSFASTSCHQAMSSPKTRWGPIDLVPRPPRLTVQIARCLTCHILTILHLYNVHLRLFYLSLQHEGVKKPNSQCFLVCVEITVRLAINHCFCVQIPATTLYSTVSFLPLPLPLPLFRTMANMKPRPHTSRYF